MSETIGQPRLELGLNGAGLKKGLDEAAAVLGASMSRSDKLASDGMRRIQRQIDQLNAVKPRQAMFELGQAVQKMGGVSVLSADQVARLRRQVEGLAAAGAKAPKSLAGLASTGTGGKALGALATGGGISGALGAMGPGGIVAAGALGMVTVAAVGAARAVADLSSKAEGWSNVAAATGMSVQSVQKLSDYLEDAGFSSDDLLAIMKNLQTEIATGGKGLEKYGISVKALGLDSMTMEQQLQAVARAIMSIQDPMLRGAAATEVFGKSGMRVLAAIAGVARGAYKELSALSEKQVADLLAVDEQLDKAGRSWENWSKRAKLAILEVIGLIPRTEGVARAAASYTRAGAMAGVGPLRAGQPSLPALLPTPVDTSPLTLADSEAEAAIFAARRKKQQEDLDKEKAKREAIAAKEEAADRKRVAAILKEREEQDALAKTLLEADKKLMESSKAYWELQEKLSDQVTQKILADFLVRTNTEAEQINALGEKVAIVSAGAMDASRRRASAAAGGSGQLVGDIKDGGLPTGFFTRYKDVAKDLGIPINKVVEGINTMSAAAAKAETIFNGLSNGLALLGGALGGLWDRVLQVMNNISGSFKGFSTMSATGKFNTIAGAAGQLGSLVRGPGGSALAGAAGGAMTGAAIGSIIPGIGTLVGGVVGGVAGAIGGFLKGRSAKKLADEAKKVGEFLGGTVSTEELKVMKEAAKAAGIDFQTYLEQRKKEIERQRAIEERQKLESGLAIAKEGAEGLMARLADAGAGLSDALKKTFRELIGKVSDALMKSGLGILDARLAKSDKFQAAQGMAGDVGKVMTGMRQAGMVDTGLMAAGGAAAKGIRDEAVAAALAAGLSQAEAEKAGTAAIAPLLREQLNASLASGKELDANTKALLEEAKKNGIEIIADPAIEAVAVAKDSRALLKTIAGQGGGRGRGEPGAEPGGGGAPSGGAAPGGGPPPNIPTAQKGIGPFISRSEGLIHYHPDELIWVLPPGKHGRGTVLHAASGLYATSREGGRDREGGGGAGGGPGSGPGSEPGGAGGEPATGGGGGSGQSVASAVAAAAKAAAAEVVRRQGPPISITNAPRVEIVDQSAVKTLEGQRAFAKFVLGAVEQALDQNARGLTTRIEQIARRAIS